MASARNSFMENVGRLVHMCMTEVRSSHAINFRTMEVARMETNATSVTTLRFVNNL
jgi:hypothetical protein